MVDAFFWTQNFWLFGSNGKLSQNDVDEADTAVVCAKRRLAIWILGEIAKSRLRQNADLFS